MRRSRKSSEKTKSLVVLIVLYYHGSIQVLIYISNIRFRPAVKEVPGHLQASRARSPIDRAHLIEIEKKGGIYLKNKKVLW